MRMAELDMDMQNGHALAGHNNPPGAIEFSAIALTDLARFMTNTPVIETAEHASEAALFVERTRKTLQDLDDARKSQVKPLNDEVAEINATFKAVREPLDRVLTELKSRLTAFARIEEARRLAEAERARRAAELLELEARVAEQRERDAKANATMGEVVDVAQTIVEADTAFATFARADRAAAVAERNAPVRIASQLGGRAVSMRAKETLTLDDPMAAIIAIGLTEGITEAILTAARAYRKLKGKLPDGVSSELSREI